MSQLTAIGRRLLRSLVQPLKAAGRHLERTLARRLSERYAGEIKQFDDLARAMRELDECLRSRLDKLEGFQWDQVALARRLARLEDHVEQLLRAQEMNRTESIPFRTPVYHAPAKATSQEAA